MNIIFETPRLYLRQFTLDDTTLVLRLNSDLAVLQYLHEPVLKDEAHAAEILTNIIFPQYKNNLGRLATFLKDSNEFIGWCGLKYRPEREEIDLGYRFIPAYWGNGYAYEAAKYTVDHGLHQLQLKTISGMAHIQNIASWKILEKIGMHFIKEDVVDHCPVKTYAITNSK
jgi:ribosomal-protein-alanine N-acetyltransferase